MFHSLLRLTSSLCKVVHLLRTVPPCFCKKALSFFDDAIRSAFSLGTGLCFDPNSWKQVCLPFRLGGFGMRSAVLHSPGAYLASVANAANLDGWDASLATGWEEAKSDFFTFSGKDNSVFSAPVPPSQKSLSYAVDQLSFDTLLESSCLRDKARLLSVSSGYSSYWLSVVPSGALNQLLDSREFCILAKFWCGLKLTSDPAPCPFCQQAMDEFGYHALTCKKGGCLGVRHNALRKAFIHFCKIAGITNVGRETAGLIAGSNARPADVLLPPSCMVLPDASSSSYNCLDFAVSHTLQYLSTCADVSAGAAAKKYEDGVKFPRYLADCFKNNLIFTPMVVEVYGAWGPASEDVFKFVSKAAGFSKLQDPDRVIGHLGTSLSFALQRQNAITLLKHLVPSSPDLSDPVPGPSISANTCLSVSPPLSPLSLTSPAVPSPPLAEEPSGGCSPSAPPTEPGPRAFPPSPHLLKKKNKKSSLLPPLALGLLRSARRPISPTFPVEFPLVPPRSSRAT